MKIVSILNHKGGVGKTTFCGNTAQALALSGHSVLVVDNDSQHNLSSLFGLKPHKPNIRDIYLAPKKDRARIFLNCVKKTEIENLHIVTSTNLLCDSDVSDVMWLKETFDECFLDRFYDYILIDNSTGIDKLQSTSIFASDMIFVPTELKQFAIDGLIEMDKALRSWFKIRGGVSRVIPNFYRDVKTDNAYLDTLKSHFPGKVTDTAIPIDPVFDELVRENKILFLHRLYSKGAAYYLKLMHELFSMDEDELWDNMVHKRKERISLEARERFFKRVQEQNS